MLKDLDIARKLLKETLEEIGKFGVPYTLGYNLWELEDPIEKQRGAIREKEVVLSNLHKTLMDIENALTRFIDALNSY